jgi:hypothetical protein
MPGAIKTESIRNCRAPTDVTQIRQFLGLCSFFRRTIESFAQTARPLTKLTQKDRPWKGGPLPEDAQKAFQQLQSSSKPCLTPVNFKREFILTVDSSSIGVGAILSQFNNKGIEHPCAYASRVLTQAKTKYSPCHLEASGLQWSTRHFRPYLIGRHFTIRTDHNPWVSMNKTHSLALDRIYAELIDTLPFTTEYLQGNKMPADGFSRLGQMVSDLAQLNLKSISATESEWRLNATSDQLYSMQKEYKYVKALVCYLKFEKLPDSSTLRAFVLKLANRAIFRLRIVGILQNGEFLTMAPLVL